MFGMVQYTPHPPTLQTARKAEKTIPQANSLQDKGESRPKIRLPGLKGAWEDQGKKAGGALPWQL